MKKDIEWLKKEIEEELEGWYGVEGGINEDGINAIKLLIDQLDEPEVTHEQVVEWIENNDFYDHATAETVLENAVDKGELGYYGTKYSVVEKPTIPKFVADWIEFKKKSRIPYENVLQAIDELVNSSTSKAHDWVLKTSENKDDFARAWLDGYEVEEEQKYYVVKSNGLDGVVHYFTRFNDEMNGLFTLPNDKKRAYRFDDKEKAQAIANYTNGKVEELEG